MESQSTTLFAGLAIKMRPPAVEVIGLLCIVVRSTPYKTA
jgi:hypothetical protein